MDGPELTRRAVRLLVAVAVLVGLAGLVLGAAAAQEDSEPGPQLQDGEKVNATAVELLFVDDEGVDASSIDAGDFLLSEGELERVSVRSAGTNATATLVLADPLESETLSVGIAPESDIQSVDGTTIPEAGNASVTVPEMDGSPPGVLGTNVSDARGGPAELEFRFDEGLTGLVVEITGPENVTLGLADFENPRANRYVTEFEPPESGEYRVELVGATDEADNTGNYSIARTVEADRSAPEAAIGIDFAASSGTTITLEAAGSGGERLTYSWEFDDGTTASGERVSHVFAPGEQTVTLTVEDGFGNTDQDRLGLNLTDGFGGETVDPGEQDRAAVIVEGDDPDRPQSSLISATGAPAGQPLEITDDERSLLDHGDVTLDRISLVPNVDTSFSLALTALSAGDIRDTGEESVALGGFAVLSDVTDDELADAEFEFTVGSDRLDTGELSAEDIALYRDTGDGWEPLESSAVGTDDGRNRFNASTPGFSRFAVVGTTEADSTAGENEPEIELTAATVAPTELEAGETATVTATLDNRGAGTGSFTAGLEIDGSVVDTRETELAGGDSETVEFTPTLEEPGTVAVSVNGTDAGEVTVTAQDDPGEFSVGELALNESSIAVGETVRIEAEALNEGEETAGYVAELQVDGEVVDTTETPAIPPGGSSPIVFTTQFDEEGSYTVAIGEAEAPEELEVTESGGVLPLGFLPLGLVRTVVAFVGIPLLVGYLVLKSAAFYLGY